MPPVALRFGTPAGVTPGPVPLRFGAAAPQIEGTLTATLPAPALSLTLSATGAVIDPSSIIVAGTLSLSLPPPASPLAPALHAETGVPASTHATLPMAAPPALAAHLSARTGWPASLTATLPAPAVYPLTATIAAQQITNGHTHATLPPAPPPILAVAAQAAYDSELHTGVSIAIGIAPPAARPKSAGLVIRTQDDATRHRRLTARQAAQSPRLSALRIRLAEQPRLLRILQMRTAQQHPLTARLGAAVTDQAQHHRTLTALQQQMRDISIGPRIATADLARILRILQMHTAQQYPVAAGVVIIAHSGLPLVVPLHPVTAQQYPLRPGLWRPPPGPGPDPDARRVRLRFCHPATGTALRFGCPLLGQTPTPAGITIPIREVYTVINTFSLIRADTSAHIECEGLQIALDCDSYTWTWSATIPAHQLTHVRPAAPGEHIELIATLNGTPIRLVIERIDRDRRFAESRLRIAGRGRAAWLSDPHSLITTHTNATAQTAQQILDAALSINGVPLGWTIDWRIDDWLIPPGAYSHTGSYIDHANRIAEAAGAIIQPHDTDQTLIVQPRYPAVPWAWHALTPDIEIPENVVEVEGIEWLDRPAYNAVWVGDGNRLDKTKRAGTAGDNHAQTIIDPLATAPEATRQRGIATLSDTGRQAHIRLRLPLLPETGLIRPGQLIRYTEQGTPHIGLARAVTLDYAGLANVWQTIRIETHELEPV
jgi:hypothetical protein